MYAIFDCAPYLVSSAYCRIFLSFSLPVLHKLDRVTDFQIGFGALPNHHCILKSLSYKYPIPPYDDTLVDRFQDPGAGAFTYVSLFVVVAFDDDG